MREWVRSCDLCGDRISEHFAGNSHLKVHTEISKSNYEFDICHKCERHMVRYIIKARKMESKDEKGS